MTNRQNKCFISLVVKALEIKKKFKLYASEKEYAKAEQESEDVNKCLGPKFSESFNTLLNRPKSVKAGLFNRFLVDDSVENFILKSVFGFLGGIVLTYICFMFLVFSLNFTLKRATYICIGLGIILSLGLAFSVKIRCTVFLCIPQLFSKRGRQALLAYAFILALSGPAKNTLHNVEVMSESLACTQEQLKQAENDLLKCVQKPNAAAKRTVEKLLEKINFAVKDFKNLILQLYKNCFDILETVLHAQKWLYSITLLCQKKMGKPAHRCLNLLAETKDNCEQILHTESWRKLCEIHPRGQEMICSTNTRFVCMKDDVPESLSVLRLQKQLESFKHRAMNILQVSIEAHQTYSQTNRSYTYHEEYQGMATEIRQKTDQFLQYFDFMSVIFGIFILVLFAKVIIYRHKFLTEDHYDNRYITSDFVDIDNTRAAFRMDTLLPLEPRERLQYIKVTSVRLVPSERVRLLSSFVFLIFATFKIIIHMLTDSSLYWILSTVRRNERLLYMSTLKEEDPVVTVRVVGDGLVAELFRNVTKAVKRESALVRLDPTPCLPDPVPPDWNRYYQISLVLICWLLALCEPYGLRLRHAVMVTYHPDRARERAIWLYNRIISNRISFVKASRRQLRRKYKDVWLEKTFRYKFMRKGSSPRCLLCKTAVTCVDSCVKCTTAKCVGLYCVGCFSSLKLCSVCTAPGEYGDLSDVSEEKDSSEEECPKRSPGRTTGTKKAVNTKKKKKGGIPLKIKKTNIKLKEAYKSQMTQKTNSESLIQPTLLLRALNYCRSKMPTFGKLKTLSDFESSDWDHYSTVTSGGSSAEEKLSDAEKRSEAVDGEGDTFRKSERGKEKDPGGSTRRKVGEMADERGDRRLESLNKSVPKVCLFRKVSAESLVGQSEAKEVEKSLVESEVRPMPDFCFKVHKKASIHRSKSRINLLLPSESIPGDADPADTLRRENTIEASQPKRSASVFRDSSRKRNSGVLVNDHVIASEIGEAKFQARLFTRGQTTQIIVDPLELDAKFSERKKRSPRKLPFIDPDNVHEFDPGMDSDEETLFGKDATGLRSGGDEGGRVAGAVRSGILHTASRARVCYRTAESSGSAPDNFKVCSREGNGKSSSESGCQFYYRPLRSSQTYFRPENTSGDLKRASGKLNLKTLKFSDSYAVETDSSNDKFLSVKPSHRVNKLNTK